RDRSLEELMERAHDALRPTRGAAIAIADLERGRGKLRYTGVGNISGLVVAPDGNERNMMSHGGTLGHTQLRVHVLEYVLPEDGLVVLFSDGLLSRTTLSGHPGLANRDP